ncbi:MAG: hypothetical protein GC205_06925 [Bacteroidetes bacterium]|nr:hypothetical protein [Bacteroidota bacterium]
MANLAVGCKTTVPSDAGVPEPTVLPADDVQMPDSETTAPSDPTPAPFQWPSQEEQVLSLQTTPCLGTCPVYQLEVYRDGTLRYQGSQFTERIGTYRGKVDLPRLNAILKQAEAMNFAQLADVYPTGNIRIMDLPSSILFVRSDTWQKQVVSRRYANPEVEGEQAIVDQLKELQASMDALLENTPLHLVGEGRQD